MRSLERIIFMGTPQFAVPTLQALVTNNKKPLLVITQPDRKRGRRQKVSYSPVKKVTLENDLPLIQPESVNRQSVIDEVRSYDPQLIITAAFGKILGKRFLNIADYGCINLHPSLLPKYRGPSPVNWTLFNAEEITGNTIFYVNSHMDAGDIILQSRIMIQFNDTYGSLLKKLSEKGAKDILKALSLIEECKDVPQPQNDRYATYSKLITRETCKINWADSAKTIYWKIRGLSPYPGAFSYLKGRELKILEAVPTIQEHPSCGKVVEILKGEGFLVTTGYRLLLVKKVKPAGKPEMSAYAYCLGAHILNEYFTND
ncbi:MAG TPA: methionyl-tRNA formyltransferase [Candidatus Cloacimonetes bacterium]|nr:methionyl-tRNA formyltransferase [Candidatus Cloacimonadota bacterium]HEX37383.1 methionyl-tRNA formyltransferase [Candidatus Cloacimonadota bacterium]